MLPDRMFRAAAVVPPTVLSWAPEAIDTAVLPPSLVSPLAPRPMMLPAIRLPYVLLPTRETPFVWWPAIRLPAPEVVPPMVLLGELSLRMPKLPLLRAAVPATLVPR